MGQAGLIFLYILTFVAVVAAVQLGLGGVLEARASRSKINRRLTMLSETDRPEEVYETWLRNPATTPGGGRVLADLHDRVWNACRKAGLMVTPLRLALYVGGAGLGLWLLMFVLLGGFTGPGAAVNGVVSFVAAVGLASLGAYVFVSGRSRRRLKKLEEQLPLALDIVNRAIRAGHPVVSAVNLAATELGDPIGSEFGLIVDETTYGADFKTALLNFARRSGSSDAHFFAVSVSIQTETGGNLAQILEGLAKVVRGRHTLSKRVKALASEGRASALVLSVLPLLVIGGVTLSNPTYYTSKFSDPLFWPIVIFIAVLYLVGQQIINRIINFRY